MTEDSARKHSEHYATLRPLYEQFASKLNQLAIDLLAQAGVPYHTTEFRAKSIESFSEKTSRSGKTHNDPLRELSDLAGIRVILYYQEDVDRVSDILRSELSIDENRSIDKRSELAPDQFGYMSTHLVVALGPSRMDLPEWSAFNGLVAEFQIRTVLQHAWASISHALQYKREQEIPALFRRKLIRLSGLLELADEQFSELRSQQRALADQLVAKFEKKDLNVKLDLLSVTEFLRTSASAKEIIESAQKAGFHIEEGDEKAVQVVAVANSLGITAISELNDQLEQAKKISGKFFRSLAKRYNYVEVRGDVDHWCSVILVAANRKRFTKRELYRQRLWSSDYRKHVLDVAKVIG